MVIMLDTDVLISAIFYPSERTRRFIREVSEGHTLLLCDCVVEELEWMIENKLPAKKTAMEQFFIALPFRLVVTDSELPGEERILRAALNEDVDILISGDRALLRRKVGLTVLTMSEFLGRMIMRKMLSWKLVLRARLKTALTLLLIIAATFLFLYNLLEYTMTNRQYQEAMAQYWGNLTLDRPTMADGKTFPAPVSEYFGHVMLASKANPSPTELFSYEKHYKTRMTAEDIAEMLELPYVDDVAYRYMTAGLSDDFERIDTHTAYQGSDYDFTAYTARMVVEATVVDFDCGSILGVTNPPGEHLYTSHNILVDDVKVLAGKPEWLEQIESLDDFTNLPDGMHRIQYSTSTPKVIERQGYIANGTGEAGIPSFYSVNHIDESFPDTLIPGERYIFVCRVSGTTFERMDIKQSFGYLYLGDDSIYNWWPYAYNITDLPENYIDGEEFAPLRELIKITNDDIRTMDVIYSGDMRTLRRYQEGKFLLMEGRLLNEQDTADKKPVCVVADTFAETYGLKIGDTVSLRLGDKLFETYAPIGAIASYRTRYADNFTEKQEFEIVGLYHETGLETLGANLRFWTYSENAIFVPQSFLTVSEEVLSGWTYGPADVSFIVSDVANIAAFENEVYPTLSSKGYAVYYSDGNWPIISKQLQQTGFLSLLKLVAFSAAVILVLLLTMYLFVIQRKKEFAVMRALGCPKKNAVAVLLFPLSLLAVIGVAIGAGLAVCYTSVTIAEKLQSYTTFGISVDSSVPVSTVVLSILGCFILLMIFAAVGLTYVARLNPLELLQGGKRVKKEKVLHRQPDEPMNINANISSISILADFVHKNKPAHGFTRRYIHHHICRSMGKSLLIILVTAMLIGAMGQFAAVRNSYHELYQNVDVKVRFLDFEHSKAKKFAETDYVTGGYFEYNYDRGELPIPGKDRTERVYGRYCLNNDLRYHLKANIEFLEGYYEDTVMQLNERVCVMPRFMMEKLGAKLGDTVEFNEHLYQETAMALSGLTEEEGEVLYHRHSVQVKIVGCIETGDDTIYIPLASNGYYKSIFHTTYLSVAEFSLGDYHKALELLDYAKTLIEPTETHQPRLSMDTSEADRIYNTCRILDTLYPIAFATAVIIGAVLMGLLVLQRTKEAATLRILGTTKLRTRMLFVLEQILLCLIGLLLAIGALFVLNGVGVLRTSEAICIYLAIHVAACVIGCIAGAVSVTRHKALELLQVKE